MSSTDVRITEIFYSIQGEAHTVGFPTVFIRLTGCPLRCQYCDTAYAFSGGETLSQAQTLEKVKSFNPHYVTVTGGEPLAQAACLSLLKVLCDENYAVSLETSGALAIDTVDSRVSVVMDLKTPGSEEEQRNHYPNIGFLKAKDQVKFVICDRNDFEWSVQQVTTWQLLSKCEVLFSASQGQLADATLAEWVLETGLAVRLQVQLHKYLWGDTPGV